MEQPNKIIEAKKKFVAILASLVILAISDLWISRAYTHELWLEPKKFHISTNEMLEVNVKLGEKLQGAILPFLPASFEEFYWSQNGDKNFIKSRLGDRPAFSALVPKDGLISVIYVSKNVPTNFISQLKSMDASVSIVGNSYDESLRAAIDDSKKNGWISKPPCQRT